MSGHRRDGTWDECCEPRVGVPGCICTTCRYDDGACYARAIRGGREIREHAAELLPVYIAVSGRGEELRQNERRYGTPPAFGKERFFA